LQTSSNVSGVNIQRKALRPAVSGKQLFSYLLLTLVAVIMIIPFVWMLSGSLKNEATSVAVPGQLSPDQPVWSNYHTVWTRVPFEMFYLNTIKIAVISTLGVLIVSALAAYAFAKLQFPGRDKLFLLYLATMMIPGQVTMIPQFTIIKEMGLINNHWALILLDLVHPFGVFLLRQFFIGIPNDLSESARIDGCSEFGIFARIIVPLSKPAIATLTIFTLLGSWNSFLNPLIYLSSKELYTLQIGIRYFQQLYGTEYPLIMAATTLSLLPIIVVYLFTQRYFIEGISTTGLKG
jgi:multiple sugar transport system permease protein